MCIITATAVAAALGISVGASAAGAAGIGAAGVIAGIANAAIVAGTVGSAVMGVTSSIQQGKAQQAQANYQAQVAKENARIAENNAAVERQQGIEEARLQRIKTAQAIGSQKTAMAANGVDVTQGTALDVIEDTATMGELDALQTRYNYERKALSYEATANNFSNQANLDIIAGKNARTAGTYGAISSGLAGLSKTGDVASKWFDLSGNKSASGVLTGYTPQI